MNSIKKRLCFIFALILSINLLFISSYAKYFNDIPISHWALDDINIVSDNGIMGGTSPNYFSPNDNVKKGMLMYILYVIEGKPQAKYTYISDVSSTEYYAVAVSWALNNGIATLDTSGHFCPENSVTKEQCVTFFARYCDAVNYNSNNDYSSYEDFDMISEYAVKAFKWAIDKKIVSGTTMSNNKTYLYPGDNINRAQLSSIISRYIRNIEGFTAKDSFSFNNNSYINGYTTGKYMLTDSDYQILTNKIYDAYLPESDFSNSITREDVMDLVQSKINSKVKSDLSFGYCAVLGLHKYGKFNLLNCDTDAKNISEISLSPTVVSKINYYSLVGDILQLTSNKRDAYQSFISESSLSKGWKILTYYDNDVPYSIIVTDCQRDGNKYIYNAYDPLSRNDVIIEYGNGTCRIKKNNTVTNIRWYKLFDIKTDFNKLDIDGDYNNIK